MQYMGAIAIARAKELRDDSSIVEIVIWALQDPLPPCGHRYKYCSQGPHAGLSAQLRIGALTFCGAHTREA